MLVLLLPVPSLPLAHGKSHNVHHEHPRQRVHRDPAALDEESGSRGDQLAVQHCSSHEDSHHNKEQHEQNVHDVAQARLVIARLLQEPARLQQRVGDLAAKEDGAALDAGLPQPQRQQDSQDAHGVVGQHNGSLCAEVHAPGHVEEKVAQAQHHGADLQRGVLSAWRSQANGEGSQLDRFRRNHKCKNSWKYTLDLFIVKSTATL